jgi:predicted permease
MHLGQDIRFALRGFHKSPGFTAVALLSLALGIGGNTAIFSLIDQLILRSLPIRDPQSVVLLNGIGRHYGGNNGPKALSYPMYQDFRDRNEVFSGMMCRYPLVVTLGVNSRVETIGSELVSGNYFPLLGIHPAEGRLFTADDDLHPGSHPLAVLSYAYWQARFAGDPKIVGQTVRINAYPLTVVGVAQNGFTGMEPGLPAQVFIPIAMAQTIRPGFTDMFNRRLRWVNVYGRLKPGITIERARAGMQPLFHSVINREVLQPAFRKSTPYDREQFLRMSIDTAPGSQGVAFLKRQYENPLWVLMGVTGTVLLITCANLASLLAARAASRRKEMAIRLAMGAGRLRIVGQLLTESLMLSLAGGIAGTALSVFLLKALLAFLPSRVNGYSIATMPDFRILAFAFALSLVTGIAFGLVPALQATRPDIAPTLKDEAGSVASGHIGFRKALIAAQVTLSLILLIGAGLFVRTLTNLRLADSGFHTAGVVQFTISPRQIGYSADRTTAVFRDIVDRLRQTPGVRAAGMANMAPLTGNEWDNWVTIDSYEPAKGEVPDPHMNAVSPGYFESVGIHILEGRDFSARDDAHSQRVAIVNASFARKYFRDGRAIGHRFGSGSDPGTPVDTEIVGIVNDARYESMRDPIPAEIYLCAAQRTYNAMSMYVSWTHGTAGAATAIRQAVDQIDPDLPITNMKTFDRQFDESMAADRMIASLSAVFGIMATGLVLMGIYGVMSFTVTRRSREIGIRMALGALEGNVIWLILREVMMLLSAGVLIGLPVAYALSRLVRAQLYGIDPADPSSIVLATVLLAVVATIAGYVPARRAASFNPLRILRYE